ncbi:MAG: VOC family protein [Acidimicrobiales bacterium]
MVRGIHHAGLVVDDLERAIDFYGQLLEMELIETDEWSAPSPMHDQAVGLTGSTARGVMLRGSNSYLELWTYAAPSQIGPDPAALGANERGLRHLAIEVDDVPAAWRLVQQLGGSAMGEPVTTSEGGAAVVYCRDPFGTILELMSTGGELAALDDLGSRS